MDTKYRGIRCVKASVSRTSNVSYVIKNRTKKVPSVLLRIIVSFMIILGVYIVKNIDNPTAQSVFSAVETVVYYSYEEVEQEEYFFDKVVQFFEDLSD